MVYWYWINAGIYYISNGNLLYFNHNFAHFGILCAAVLKFTARQQCATETDTKPENATTEEHTMDQTDKVYSTRPKLIDKDSSRSEIWHYFAYKSDDKGEATDLNAPICKHCFKSCVATHQIWQSTCHLLIPICSKSSEIDR